MTEELVEKVARALIERQIRIARKWDTAPAELEAILPESVDYSWREREEDARAALVSIQEDYAIVPREASNAMLEFAGTMEGYDTEDQHHLADEHHRNWYSIMISAAERTSQ